MSTGAVDDSGPAAALNRFDPLVRDWFTAAFAEPTSAQAGAWDAIGKGDHTLVVAPTGSGKTLAAFLSAIDDLVSRADAARRGVPPIDVLTAYDGATLFWMVAGCGAYVSTCLWLWQARQNAELLS